MTMLTEELAEDYKAFEKAQETKRLTSEAVNDYRSREATFMRKLALTTKYGPPTHPCNVSENEAKKGVPVIKVPKEDKSYFRLKGQ